MASQVVKDRGVSVVILPRQQDPTSRRKPPARLCDYKLDHVQTKDRT